MHAVLFSLKRTYLGILARTRRIAAIFGLTPARFDMVFAIAKHSRYGLSQARLCRVLGLSGATVSRMAKSIQDLGFITRIRSRIDRRCLELRLTPLGQARLEHAVASIVETGGMDVFVARAIAYRWPSPSAITDVMNFEGYLRVARRNLDDRATLRYPWHPDDGSESPFAESPV